MFEIIDRTTKKVVATAKTRQQAIKKRDRLDNAYGSYQYAIKEILN